MAHLRTCIHCAIEQAKSIGSEGLLLHATLLDSDDKLFGSFGPFYQIVNGGIARLEQEKERVEKKRKNFERLKKDVHDAPDLTNAWDAIKDFDCDEVLLSNLNVDEVLTIMRKAMDDVQNEAIKAGTTILLLEDVDKTIKDTEDAVKKADESLDFMDAQWEALKNEWSGNPQEHFNDTTSEGFKKYLADVNQALVSSRGQIQKMKDNDLEKLKGLRKNVHDNPNSLNAWRAIRDFFMHNDMNVEGKVEAVRSDIAYIEHQMKEAKGIQDGQQTEEGHKDNYWSHKVTYDNSKSLDRS